MSAADWCVCGPAAGPLWRVRQPSCIATHRLEPAVLRRSGRVSRSTIGSRLRDRLCIEAKSCGRNEQTTDREDHENQRDNEADRRSADG